MSETREPQYLELNEKEDFKLDAHVDSDGQQRFAVIGYLVRHTPDGVYRTPLIPEMFFGVNGEQLDTWSQYLTKGDHTILRRDSGNPHVPDSDLNWVKVSNAPQRPVTPQFPATLPAQPMAIPVVPILVLIGVPVGLYLLYRALGKAVR